MTHTLKHYNSLFTEYETTKKELFLHKLRGKNLTYKRYTKSPLRYGGGKSLAVGLILEQIPSDTKRLISRSYKHIKNYK
ncbi:hypothetical protein [Helicobacter canadensis]|uniref:Adenine specific DNA methyltransferase n=1 Tax=Helicobacter canadensis MIT 98-5491 TaxID=537970 RepID=C5ZXP2_9HELI|nr:hypothetical protein [Helicobacter canadensis]EES89910.1 adenine specific DNA methyltransferase [Helicobacter canadensis MIT 98-5491]EFR49056.1 hypothetical protein HCMG_01229 [Helicobacter canadensis MIT 98-5491]STP02590.1 adenine-specific DNA-methyltransferase [Helicobacter canadensis]